MFTRGRSKDRTSRKVTPPSASYMSNDQFANYLAELRDNRIARPGGARPGPAPSNSRMSLDQSAFKTYSPAPAAPSPNNEAPPGRAESIISHRRARSSMSISSRTARALVQPPAPSGPPLSANVVVPSATYMVRGQRWMEREEMTSLRDALEDMDTNEELEAEIKLHAAAQQEASDLVFRHQNPQPTPEPDAPYRYRDHMRKNSYQHARAQSVGPYTGPDAVPVLGFPTRSFSNGSNVSSTQRDRVSSGSSTGSDANQAQRPGQRVSFDEPRGRDPVSRKGSKSYGSLAHTIGHAPSRRRSSGKRNISGEFRSSFTTDQIWEEPAASDDEAAKAAAMKGSADAPAPLRVKPRNPLNRVQFEADPAAPRAASTPPLELKPRERFEIYKNPPSQSRNAGYTANPAPAVTPPADSQADPLLTAAAPSLSPTKDGREIRSDDIRTATTKSLRDRSPLLPTPSAVSDAPGRPIVSFDQTWTPPSAAKIKTEADVTPAADYRRPRVESKFEATRPARKIGGPREAAGRAYGGDKEVVGAVGRGGGGVEAFVEVKGGRMEEERSGVRGGVRGAREPLVSTQSSPDVMVRAASSVSVPAPPTISVEEAPTISISSAPSISVSEPPSISVSGPPVISVSSPPAISVSGPPPPSISVSGPPAISISEPPAISVSRPPAISVNSAPTISVSTPPVPSIVEPSTSSRPTPRALPDPKVLARNKDPFARPNRISTSHWSPAPAPAGARATATCHYCRHPIAGRVIALAGHAERWHPGCFSCHCCRTQLADFEIKPEPEAERAARLDRIARRRGGEVVEGDDEGGARAQDDGDERLRFYCHLDWHELFAPRCRHCKTPIVGSHVVAMGAHFHTEHFFCAECGDPFPPGSAHVELDGYAWCTECVAVRTERRAPKCGLCKKPVVGRVVGALGREFHEDCFRCGECGGGFGDGEIFLRGDVGVACRGCMERGLKA
ncbi:hypothetical protein VF21_02739 [Pseudogymnoascus sp. 05NY08]|nr:hypothetical protein VF21_02739 [Pseudogymnoascus sp. 05NY08]